MLDAENLRRDFPILKRKVHGHPLAYLDNAATTQKPSVVIKALTDFYENHNANIHRGVHTLAEEATQLVEDSRQKAADFIGAKTPSEIVFTRNATESINLVAQAWGRKNVKAGDEIVLTELEHHSNLVPWQMLAAEKGAKLRFVPIKSDGTLDLEAGRSLFNERTKIFSFTAASNAIGTLNDVPALIQLARGSKALCLVDAAQWAPHFKMDVSKWDCDFAVFSAHKMLGPTGIGVLYGKEKILEAMDPFLGGGDMIARVWLDHFTPNILPHKFEAGTPHIAGIAAFAAALEYLSGLDWSELARHESELSRRLIAGLAGMPEVHVYGPSRLEQRCGIVSFNVLNLHPHDVGTALDLEGVAVRAGHHCCQPLMNKLGVPGTARASFYLYNTAQEVDALLAALRKAIAFFKPKERVA